MLSNSFSQTAEISEIKISSKINGVAIKLISNKPIDEKQTSAWFDSNTGWFYVTSFQTTGNKLRLENIDIIEPVKKVEVFNSNESIQIGIKLSTPVETFEKYHLVEPSEINFALRFPLSDIIVALENEKPTSPLRFSGSIYNIITLNNAMYLTGSLMIISKFLSKNDPIVGFSIVTATFIYSEVIKG